MTTAERIARALRDEGIELAFGLPGGEVTELIEAMRAVGIRFLLTKHESSAAFAAQTYGLLTGTVGISVTTLGPGATNVVTGVANAYLDRAPLLAFSANLHSTRQSLATHQKINLSALFAPITKAQIAMTTGHVERNVRRASALALGDRPGPVFVELASDLAVTSADDPDLQALPTRRMERILGVAADVASLREVADRLGHAVRPIVLAGWDAARRALRDGGRTTEAIQEFAARLRAPIVVTPKAKGVIGEDNPWFLGVVEGAQTARIFSEMEKADAIVAVGMDAVELDRWWDFPARVLAIGENSDSDPAIPYAWQIVGAIHGSLQVLQDLLPEALPYTANPGDSGDLAALRSPQTIQAWRAVHLRPQRVANDSMLEPHEAVTALRRAAPRDAKLVTDVGMHKLVAAQYWETYGPGQYFVSNGLSSMGFGIPTAMAVHLADPESPVVALVGDGGFAMTMGELETLCREGIGIVIVVLVDESLMLIRQSQERKGYPAVGVDFSNPDLRVIARAFSMLGLRAESSGDLETALAKALQHTRSRRKPALIEVPVRRRQY